MIRLFLATLLAVFIAGCERDAPHNQTISSGDDSTKAASLSLPRIVAYRFALPEDDAGGGSRPSGFSLLQPDGSFDLNKLDELKKAEATLTDEQIDRFMVAVFEEEERASPMACYDPHHAFLIYDDSGELSKVIEICFSCTKIRTHPAMPQDRWNCHDFRALARLCDEIGIGLGSETADQFIQLLDERDRL